MSKTKAVGKSTAKKKPAGEVGFCCYIGPTIMGVVQNGTIYRGTKSEVLKSLASATDKYPLIASLVVTGDTLPVDRIKVKTPGNLMHVNYCRLKAGIK